MRFFTILSLTLVLSLACTHSPQNITNEEDLRAYMHGIDLIKINEDNYALVYSSSGLPPRGPNFDGSWPHDVYYAIVNPSNIQTDYMKSSKLLINTYEAQEPASTAINDSGQVLITMEDASRQTAGGYLSQSYGLYRIDNNELIEANTNKYPQWIRKSSGDTMGHSGHVASAGDNFVIFYSEEWVYGGGVDNLGSGDDVYVDILNGNGDTLYPRIEIAVGDITRDWWPMLASARDSSCLLWQRFVPGESYADLYCTLLNPQNGSFIKKDIFLGTNIKYYTYNLSFLESKNMYVICGTKIDDSGFMIFINENGEIISRNDTVPPIVREGQIVINQFNSNIIAYPSIPKGLAVLEISNNEVTESRQISGNNSWEYMGITGMFTAEKDVTLFALSKKGLIQETFTFP